MDQVSGDQSLAIPAVGALVGVVGDLLDVDLVVALVGEVGETGDGRADWFLAGAGISPQHHER